MSRYQPASVLTAAGGTFVETVVVVDVVAAAVFVVREVRRERPGGLSLVLNRTVPCLSVTVSCFILCDKCVSAS